MARFGATLVVAVLGGVVAGCGGGGGSGGAGIAVRAAVAPVSSSEAARLLTQASFGPTASEIEFVERVGPAYWLEYQTYLPQSRHVYSSSTEASTRVNTWWYIALRGQDQLRQRVAFALSQIFVVSDVDLQDASHVRGLANYYDLLATHAFGNYRDLLEAVTKSPMMGIYLSSVRNERADPARNIRPDENYAREVMQLFSIGLVQLRDDGIAQVDTQVPPQPIPTYDQETIEGYAAVFTGWTYAGTRDWYQPTRNVLEPMIAFESYHESAADKRLLNGQVLPGGGTAESDLDAALDSIFEHPNVGPFFCKQLIQRLVTSNPSPAYVQRVAAVFDDDGSNVRGNLGAVVTAIFLDDEAREGHLTAPTTFGKIREPLLRATALWRAFDARTAGNLNYPNPERDFAQAPLRSPTVFNFYRPDYSPTGPVQTAGLVAPELQILNDSTTTTTTNRWYSNSIDRYYGRPNLPSGAIVIYIEEEKALARANDLDGLMNRLDGLLLCGTMSPGLRTAVQNHIATVAVTAADGGARRVGEAIFLIISSPEFALQR